MVGLINKPVDRLLDIIFQKKIISTVDAAKELNLTEEQIEENAVVLKDHNIISINEKEGQITLHANQLTQKQYVAKLESFVNRQKQIISIINSVEKAISSSVNQIDQLTIKLKKFDSDLDGLIRDYNYLSIFPSRRDTTTVSDLKEKTYQKALETEKEIDKTFEGIKILEKQLNELRNLHLKLKEDVTLLQKQTDVEQVNLSKFVHFLIEIEEKTKSIEKTKTQYINKLGLIKDQVEKLCSWRWEK